MKSERVQGAWGMRLAPAALSLVVQVCLLPGPSGAADQGAVRSGAASVPAVRKEAPPPTSMSAAGLIREGEGRPQADVVADTAAAPRRYTMRGYDERIQRGIDLIYDLHFDEAEAFFGGVIAAEPDNPLGYFFDAMVAWWRVLVDLDDRSHDEAFYARLETCIEVCDRRLQEDPEDFDAILFKGGAIGFRGRLRGDRHQYVRAANDGRRCLPLLEKSRRLEPTNKDILFGQGIYNYFAEVIPQKHPIVRPVMWFLPKGDRQLGLAQLDEVARHGLYARTEATYFLAQIHRIFEDDDHGALPYLEELYERYPRNAVFHRYLARTLAAAGRWDRSGHLYAELLRRADDSQVGYHPRARLEALYYLGKGTFYTGKPQDAAAFFVAAADLGATLDEDRGYTALAQLMLGMTYDRLGQRPEAVARYQRVRQLPDANGSHKLAKKYLKEPYVLKARIPAPH